jgi:hypothetical protein
MVGYDMANQTAYLDDTLRWGLDWLIKVRQLPRLSRSYHASLNKNAGPSI